MTHAGLHGTVTDSVQKLQKIPRHARHTCHTRHTQVTPHTCQACLLTSHTSCTHMGHTCYASQTCQVHHSSDTLARVVVVRQFAHASRTRDTVHRARPVNSTGHRLKHRATPHSAGHVCTQSGSEPGDDHVTNMTSTAGRYSAHWVLWTLLRTVNVRGDHRHAWLKRVHSSRPLATTGKQDMQWSPLGPLSTPSLGGKCLPTPWHSQEPPGHTAAATHRLFQVAWKAATGHRHRRCTGPGPRPWRCTWRETQSLATTCPPPKPD